MEHPRPPTDPQSLRIDAYDKVHPLRALLSVLLIQLQYFSCFSRIFNDHSNNVNYRPTVLIAMTRQSQSIGLVAMENHQASVMQVEATFTTVMFRVPLANSAAVLASWTRMCT